jgi:hypothetical protein
MRKLALAAHAVATRDEAFSIERLFPGKPVHPPSRRHAMAAVE